MPYDPQAASVPRNPIIPLPDAPIEYPLEEEQDTPREEEEVMEPVAPGVPSEPAPAEPVAPGV
jgi:hypothetical protein